MTQYHIDNSYIGLFVIWDNRFKEWDKTERRLCPECINHDQGLSGEVHDCKNTFYNDDREIIGQCCCYSKEHGVRKTQY